MDKQIQDSQEQAYSRNPKDNNRTETTKEYAADDQAQMDEKYPPADRGNLRTGGSDRYHVRSGYYDR